MIKQILLPNQQHVEGLNMFGKLINQKEIVVAVLPHHYFQSLWKNPVFQRAALNENLYLQKHDKGDVDLPVSQLQRLFENLADCCKIKLGTNTLL